MNNINFENSVYKIPNNLKNKYLITFLSQYKIIKSIEDDFIIIDSDNIKPLNSDENIIKYSKDSYINKFIYDIGCQILLLKEYNFGIKYFSLNDFIVINDDIFVFINNDMLFELLETIDIDSSPYTYGKIDFQNIDFKSLFLPNEINSDKQKYYYYTTSFYSFAKVLLHFFDIKLKDIADTSLYFFCERCLLENPVNRSFIYI